MLQTRSRNLHHRQQLAEAQELLFDGLRELGISLKSEYSDEEVDERHRTIRKKLLDFGLDNIRNLPPATDEICNLRNVLLAEYDMFPCFHHDYSDPTLGSGSSPTSATRRLPGKAVLALSRTNG
jgi:hypothetical protein